MATAEENVELRADVPKAVIAVIDAVSGRRRKSRSQLVIEILNEWAEQAQAEAVAIQRVMRKMEDPQ